MEVFFVGVLLVVVGLMVATSGYPLFRVMLPLMGFFAGFGLGFSMVQAVTGANAFSFVAAFLTALITGLVVAALSYAYYTLGVLVIVASLLAGAFAYFGQAIGLREDGFIMGLLAMTAMFGVGMIFVGAFLLFGDFTLNDLHKDGIMQSISNVVTSSWIWLVAWIGGTVIAMQAQVIMIARAVFGDQYVIEATKKK